MLYDAVGNDCNYDNDGNNNKTYHVITMILIVIVKTPIVNVTSIKIKNPSIVVMMIVMNLTVPRKNSNIEVMIIVTNLIIVVMIIIIIKQSMMILFMNHPIMMMK